MKDRIPTSRRSSSIASLIKNLPQDRKVLLLSFIVGVSSGLAAAALVWLISFIGRGVGSLEVFVEGKWPVIILPGIGLLLSALVVKFFARENIGHGVTRVLVAMSRKDSVIKPHNMWTSLLSSSLTIGFGGSVGAEAPIVYTGAAIGSNFARWIGLNYHNITVLVGCGAAGALAGIFKAPLAGVLFTLEVLLFGISLKSLLPMMISTLSAAFVAYVFRGTMPEFACTLTPFVMRNIPFYLVLGVLGALGSVYFTRITLWLEDVFSRWGSTWRKWVVCSLGLGLLIFIFPLLFGEGYDSVRAMLQGELPDLGFRGGSPWLVPMVLLGVFLLKVLAMTLTNAGGGVGGTFGPTLFSGAILGLFVARSLNLLGADVPEANFALVGMAAMMAGVMKAPLTAIFLITELSGGYMLMIPLLFTSLVAFGVSRIFERYSIYTKRIAQSGELLTHDADQATLTLMSTDSLIRDKYPRVSPDDTVASFAKVVSESNAAVVAVVDEQGRLEGIVNIEDVRRVLFDTSRHASLLVSDIMVKPHTWVTAGEPMIEVMHKFEAADAWRMPVLDSEGHYLGFISKSRMLAAYRDVLREQLSSGD